MLKSLLASERAKLNRGELTKISYDKKIRPFFQSVDVTDIDYAMVNEFLNEISTDDLSSSTISAYIRLVRKVLQHAARQLVGRVNHHFALSDPALVSSPIASWPPGSDRPGRNTPNHR